MRSLALMPESGFRPNDTPAGDRRVKMRLEVVGELWGTLDAEEPAHILDISAGGALISSPVALAPESVQPLLLRVGRESVMVEVRVRHLRQLAETEDEPRRYALGVEFISAPASLLQFVGQ